MKYLTSKNKFEFTYKCTLHDHSSMLVKLYMSSILEPIIN